MLSKKIKNFVFLILSILIVLNTLAWLTVYDLQKSSQFLEVNFFNVGQGDAIFVETPGLHQILIDGGPDSTILEKLGKNLPFWDRSIDLIILTHPEKDHLAGILEVLKRYKVENILWTGVIRNTSEYEEWLRLIKNEKSKIFIAKVSQTITMSTGDVDSRKKPVIMEVLYPFENLESQEFKDSNITSIIAKLTFNENSFLFTGDAYKSVEYKLIDQNSNIDSDILKVGHHGSKTSSSGEFIAEVSPEIAIISVGKKNRYGHPHPEVLEILEKNGIRILRTDLDGDIKIISDGIKYEIKK